MLNDKQVDAVIDWMRGLSARMPLPPLSNMPSRVVEQWRQGVRDAISKAKEH